MSARLLEGKVLAEGIKETLKKELAGLGAAPTLAALSIGESAASAVYIKSQQKTAETLGINYKLETLPTGSSEGDVLAFVEKLNKDTAVNAVIVQLPLPPAINHRKVMAALDPLKDAEGMHPANLGKILLGEYSLAPATPLACMELIKSTGTNLRGIEAVIVGHSEIVGKPLSMMLLAEFATTTVCHIGTGERGLVPNHVKGAELLIVAVGKAGLIKGEWIKEGAIVIDVGINKVGDKIVGDVEFETAANRAAYITPTPGGVGPLTVTMLMRNVVVAYKIQKGVR